MDSRKCQTATATPAKPGELPVGLGQHLRQIVERPGNITVASEFAIPVFER